MPKLVCESGPAAGHEYPLSKPLMVLGRQSTCDIQVVDEMSSRAHCQLRRDGRLWTLVDLGSRNGTLLNGKKAGERQLTFGDRIRIGECEYQFVKESGDVELKDLLSKYEIIEKIGEGGMGIVYKASQRSMARNVALKILAPKYASKLKFVEQFIREARAAGALNHPHIIQVHDVGTENDIHYFSMEFIDGPTCMQVLKEQGPFPVAEALEITRQVALALDYAHEQRLIHQDIKPDNIMLGANSVVKLADLGISKTFAEAAADESPKKVMGTPHYMAPEAALGKKIDHRVDLYSLGATLYHLLAGRPPFNASSATDVLKCHVNDPIPPLAELNPNVPADVVALVEKLLAKKPDDRPQTAAAVAEQAKRLLGAHSGPNERIAGGETLMLQRYARSALTNNPGSFTTGARTPAAETQADAPNQRLLRQVIRWSVILGVIAFAALIARNVWSGYISPAAGTTPVVAAPSTAPAPVVGSTANSAAPVTSDQDRMRNELARVALAKLNTALHQDADADTASARQELDHLSAQDLDEANRARVKQLGDLIAEVIARRRQQQAATAFADVQKEVAKLREERNYDLALKRLDAFPERKEPALAAGVDKLRAAIETEKTTYFETLGRKVASLTKAKDDDGLKTLRDGLPKALLDGEVPKQIDAALKTLANERDAATQGLAVKAGALLAEWKLDKVEEFHRANRDAAGTTPAGTVLDDTSAAAKQLAAMITALDTKLRLKPLRITGKIGFVSDPDALGASLADGIQVRDTTGGAVSFPWRKLSGEELDLLVRTVLKNDATTYAKALSTLAAAKLANPPVAPVKAR